LKVKDHSVSGETFELVTHKTYGFLETQPKPSLEDLPRYYESEDYISHTDTKRNLFEKVYHLVRRIALNQKIKRINSHVSNSKQLLDFGCGTGDFLEAAKHNQWQVTGIEPNPQARAIANQKTNNAVFGSKDFETLKANSFDVITLWHVLEHVPNLEEKLKNFKTLLKPNGVLIIAVPNYKSYDANYYKSFWAAYDVPRHLWHFNKTSIFKLVSKFNFKLVKISPMWFDAFYVSLLSEKYKSGKMNPFKSIFIGLLSNLKAFRTKEASSLIYTIKKE
jgi:2-polyprenyl-3-methyl-5-hydroxy-6-metoxy-1,4-benzoquinol methylase